MHFEVKGTCSVARATIDMDSVKISEGFEHSICNLPDEYDDEIYMGFIDDFGTV